MTIFSTWLPLAIVVIVAIVAMRWLGPGWWFWRGGDGSSLPRKIVVRLVLFVVALAIISAVAIWFGLGPVVHSGAVAG